MLLTGEELPLFEPENAVVFAVPLSELPSDELQFFDQRRVEFLPARLFF